MDQTSLKSVLRKTPSVVVGLLDHDEREISGFGTLASTEAPESLVWEIGSITKVFTGILLAEMSLRGEVALDDPIGKYLPDQVNDRMPPQEGQPTLRHLSTHTSGLPGIPKAWLSDLRGNLDPYAQISAEQVYGELGGHTRVPARPRFRYSNFGVGLLGLLLGRAAGSRYEDLVTRRLLHPIGMTSTSFGRTGVVTGVRKGKPTPPWTFDSLGAAGALRFTASDMLTFASTVFERNSSVLGRAISMSLEQQTDKSGTGLGWQIVRPHWSDGDVVWHNGGTYGTSSFLAIDCSSGIAVVAFGNRGPGILRAPLDGAGWKLLRSGLRSSKRK